MLRGSELYGDCMTEAYMHGVGGVEWGGTEGLDEVELDDECRI